MATNGISTSIPKSGRRNLKMAIAAARRAANGDTTARYYRQLHNYIPPGTVAPVVGRPWIINQISLSQILVFVGGLLFTPNYSYALNFRSNGFWLDFDATVPNQSQIDIRAVWPDSNKANAKLYDSQFIADGLTSNFTISRNGLTANDLIVSVNGIVQAPTNDFTLTGTTLSFVIAPEANANIDVRMMDDLTSNTGTQDFSTFTGDGSTSVFNITGTNLTANDLIVSINGIVQIPAISYTLTGTALTFDTAPALNDYIQVNSIWGKLYNLTEIDSTVYIGNGLTSSYEVPYMA